MLYQYFIIFLFKIGCCDAFFIFYDFFRWSFANDGSTAFATFRTHVNNVIGTSYHIHIVFYNQYGITFISQLVKDIQ